MRGLPPYSRAAIEAYEVFAGWAAALQDEYARMLAVIPANDLAIQIDYSSALIAGFGRLAELLSWIPTDETPAEMLVRHTSKEFIAPHVAGLPEEVLLGFHICAGTFPEYPTVRMPDLSVAVGAANRIVENAGRRIDYLHLSALQDSGEAYFASLVDLKAAGAKIFIGLECNDDPMR